MAPAATPDAPHVAGTLRHDVVVVGGGLVGASLAIALALAGIDVALVEAAAAGALPAVFDERNLSFAEATVNALSALGVMQRAMEEKVASLGAHPEVAVIRDDSWSTDRITPAGREKLREAGFAPPTPRAPAEAVCWFEACSLPPVMLARPLFFLSSFLASLSSFFLSPAASPAAPSSAVATSVIGFASNVM